MVALLPRDVRKVQMVRIAVGLKRTRAWKRGDDLYLSPMCDLYYTDVCVITTSHIFNPHEGYRSVTALDAARVSRTIFRYHSAH